MVKLAHNVLTWPRRRPSPLRAGNCRHPWYQTCDEPSRSLAASTTSASSPSRAAILRALLRPGTPHSRRYVGAILRSSNSTLAFSKRSSSYFSVVRALRWALEEVSGLYHPWPPPCEYPTLPIPDGMRSGYIVSIDRGSHLKESIHQAEHASWVR